MITLQEKEKNAELCEKNSNWDDAIVLYKEITKENNSIKNIEKLGWCYSRAEKYDEAIKYFKELEQKQPQMAKWKYMIGYQYYCKKKWNDAVNYFNSALKLKPDYFVVKYRISYAYLQLAGKYKELTKSAFWNALGHIKECHILWNSFDNDKKNKEKNTYYDINFLHGKMLMNLPKHMEEATVHFKEALKIKDENICKYNLSKTYYLMGKYDEAKKELPLNDNNYYVIELKAYIEAKLGNCDKAINIINKLLKKRKKDYLYIFLANVYMLNGNREDAFKQVNIALNMNKNNHKNHFAKANVFYQYGLYNSALDEIEIAIDLKKRNYHSEYTEAVSLRESIEQNIPNNYVEDKVLLEKLEKINNKKYSEGIVCDFYKDKGFGFIKMGNEKIFFYLSDCEVINPKKGDKVIFKLVFGRDNKRKAIDIRLNKTINY